MYTSNSVHHDFENTYLSIGCVCGVCGSRWERREKVASEIEYITILELPCECRCSPFQLITEAAIVETCYNFETTLLRTGSYGRNQDQNRNLKPKGQE
jgi:hypothetical protein